MNAQDDITERILDAAAELFATHGYAATTTRAIAERAGVNEVTLFRRFQTKRGILLALGERLARRQAGHAVAQTPPGGNARQVLLRLARMEVEGALEDGGLALRLAFDARSVPEVAELLGSGLPANLEALAAYMTAAQARGELRDDVDPRVMAEVFFGLTSSYVMYRVVMGLAAPPVYVETDEAIEQLVELFWSGAAAKARR